MKDLCSDCERTFEVEHLFRCGRTVDGEITFVRLCLDCLTKVNPYLQAALIERAYA